MLEQSIWTRVKTGSRPKPASASAQAIFLDLHMLS